MSSTDGVVHQVYWWCSVSSTGGVVCLVLVVQCVRYWWCSVSGTGGAVYWLCSVSSTGGAVFWLCSVSGTGGAVCPVLVV